MRIGIDARSIGREICGVSRMTYQLISALSEIDHENDYFVYTEQDVLGDSFGENFHIRVTKCSRKNAIHDFCFYKILKMDDLDVLHVTHAWLPFFIPKNCKTIVTIHDLFSVNDPKFFISKWPFHHIYRSYFRALTLFTVKKANLIITVSHYAKSEIENRYSTAKNKVKVIYNSVGLHTENAPIKKERKKNFFLYVGNCRSYKNVETLILGYADYVNNNTSNAFDLVIAGNDKCENIKKIVNSMPISKRVRFVNSPSDDELKELYREALAFVFPSKQEGFGIPILEAMSFGLPVITSDADALLEVAAGSSLVFHWDDFQTLSQHMTAFAQDPNLRKEYILKGGQRFQHFSWEKSAMLLKMIYLSQISAKE